MVTIRSANQTDFVNWSLMRAQLWPNQTSEIHLEEIQKLFKAGTFQSWVATDGAKYVGFAEASVRPFANGCDAMPVVFFEGVWIDSKYRREGLARRFVTAIENWAKLMDIDEIGSDAESANTLSHACHHGWGFEETERVIYYRKKLELS